MARALSLALIVLTAAPAWSQTALPLSNADLIRDHLYLSPSGDHFLIFRPDGDLVVVNTDGQILWGLGGLGVPFQGADRVAMRPDGNLVVYAADGARLWSALPAGPGPSARLTISADGDLQLVTDRDLAWSARRDVTRGAATAPSITRVVPGGAEPDHSGPAACGPAPDAAGGAFEPGQTPSFIADVACIERLAHDEANRARRLAGLGPLAWSDAFAAVARSHSEDMVRRGYVSHDTPEGVSFSERMEAAGLDCSGPRAENIAGAHAVGLEWVNEADEVVSVEWLPRQEIGSAPVVSWIHSPPHRRNLLNPDHHRHAIGVAWDADAQMYRATQLLCE
jgi:uncharacterized protein YkwD